MDIKKQRFTIAKLCGWTNKFFESDSEPLEIRMWFPSSGEKKDWPHTVHSVPDYPKDLNAMREAVKTLNRKQLGLYFQTLMAICATAAPDTDAALRENSALMASAEQQAEAFLKTLEFWEEDK